MMLSLSAAARWAGCRHRRQKERRCRDVLIIERDVEPGGILLQCIHNGFGVEIFKQDLPGPSYAQRFINEAFSLGVELLLGYHGARCQPGSAHLCNWQTSRRTGYSGRCHCPGNGLPRTHSRPDSHSRHTPGRCLHRRNRPALGQCGRATCPASVLSSWVRAILA